MFYIKLRNCIILKLVGYELRLPELLYLQSQSYLCIVPFFVAEHEASAIKTNVPQSHENKREGFYSEFNRFGFCVCTK